MADSISLDRDFFTNGVKIPAGTINTSDLRDIMPRDNKGEPISEAEAKAMAQDLLRRQGKHQQYMKGIHESTRVTSDAGTIAMGGSE